MMDPVVHSDERPAARQLRAAAMRVTAARCAVLEWLGEHAHATAEQVGVGVRARLGAISTQGVYDVLGACVDAGLLRRIEAAGHPARFERRTGDNHHHLAWRDCGRIEVVFWGACAGCRGATDDAGGSATICQPTRSAAHTREQGAMSDGE